MRFFEGLGVVLAKLSYKKGGRSFDIYYIRYDSVRMKKDEVKIKNRTKSGAGCEGTGEGSRLDARCTILDGVFRLQEMGADGNLPQTAGLKFFPAEAWSSQAELITINHK